MNPDIDFAAAVGGTVGLVVSAVLAVLFLVAYATIIRKAGWSGWWVLVMFVPVINLVMLFVFAFTEWPVHRDLRNVQAMHRLAQMREQNGSRFSTYSASYR